MKKSYLCAGGAVVLWSTLAVTAKLLLQSLNNTQLLALSSFFGSFVLLIFNVMKGKMKAAKNYSFKDWITISLIGFPGMFLYHMFYYGGADILPASQAFIINYMWPVMSILFACILLKEKMTLRKIIALIMSFCGVILVSGGGFSGFDKNMIEGVIYCLTAAVCYGLFTALTELKKYDSCVSMMVNFFVTFILTTFILFIKGEFVIPDLKGMAGVLWSGIFTLAIPNTLWVVALEKGDTAKISNLAYITPFLSLVWTALILKETVSIYSLAGLFLIVGGILIQLKSYKADKIRE